MCKVHNMLSGQEKMMMALELLLGGKHRRGWWSIPCNYLHGWPRTGGAAARIGHDNTNHYRSARCCGEVWRGYSGDLVVTNHLGIRKR